MFAKYTLIGQTNIPEAAEKTLREWGNAKIYAERCANCGTLIISCYSAIQCPSVNCGVPLQLKDVTGKNLAETVETTHISETFLEETRLFQ